MKRRDILAAAGVGLAATALAGCKEDAKSAAAPQEGSSSQTFNWKMVTSWPKNFPGVGVGAERFAKLVTEPAAEDRATPAYHRRFLTEEVARWRPIIQAAGQYAD